MKTLVNALPQAQHETASLIFKMLPVALANVPFHQNTESITRLFAESFPVHLAVHEVSLVLKPPTMYTQLHVHDDNDEINIILSPKELVYKIQLGTDEHIITNDSAIWIPRGMIHAANVLYGSGYYITIRLS